MAQKRVRSSRFPGVYSRETSDPKRRHNGRPDKSFDFCYRDKEGKLKWVAVGWLSEGVTEQAAANARKLAMLALPDSKADENPQPVPQTSPEPEQPTLTLNEAADSYLAWLAGEGKHFKQEQNRYDLHVREYFTASPLSSLKIPDIDAFKQHLMAKPASVAILSVEEGEATFHRVDDKSRPRLSADTVRKTLALCRAVVNHAIRCQLYDGTNPFGRDRGLKMPRPQNKGERFLTPEEAKLFLEKLEQHSPQLRDMAYLSLKTGLRATEIFKLRGGDVDSNAGVLWIEAKGGKRQQVFAENDILIMLQCYARKPGELLFQSRTGEQLKQISDTFLRVADALGLNDGVTDSRQKVWFHTLRHTFASWMAQSGTVTLHELRDLMRHDTITMTERYAHLIPGAAKERTALIGKLLSNDA